MNIKLILLASTLLLLLGCSSSAVFQHHGDIISHNTQAQTVNHAVVVAVNSPELDGPKSQQVMETYRSDTGEAEGEQIIVNVGSSGSSGSN